LLLGPDAVKSVTERLDLLRTEIETWHEMSISTDFYRTFPVIKTTTQPWNAKRFRLIGVLPIIIFIARLIQYIQVGVPDWIVASCHISNLMLGIGMIFGVPLLIRVAAIWLIIGLPMWIIDAVVSRVLWCSSIYSHGGGFLIGLYAISKARATGKSWLPALFWFVFLQLVTRYTTAPELNVNIAHFPYESVNGWFTSYWMFWPVCLIAITAMVRVVEFMLLAFYPLNPANQALSETTDNNRL
jgi:hypothetical protein